jgi:hypothetical protein
MFIRALALIALLVAPAVASGLGGHPEVGHYLALGAVLSFQLGTLARPVAPFALLIPLLYAGGAVTAQLSDGVVALIVAVAAAVGASSSQGLHRGLLAMLAAALIGSFEPAVGGDVLVRAGALLAGCVYGMLIVFTVARSIELPARAVHPQTALSYAMLLAVVVLIAWFAARGSGLASGWWLPLAVAANGEPSISGSPRRAVAKTAAALFATAPLLAFIGTVPAHGARILLAVVLSLAVALVARHRSSLQMFLFTPIVVLLAEQGTRQIDFVQYLQSAALACAVVFAFAVLSKWVLWTLRPDAGRVTA